MKLNTRVYYFSSEVLTSIENIIQDIVKSLARREAPAFIIDSRSSWNNIKWAIPKFVYISFGFGATPLELGLIPGGARDHMGYKN